MNSREIIKRIINHDNPPRFGYSFSDPEYRDIYSFNSRSYIEKPDPYSVWGKHEELLKLTGFSGEVMRDRFGNIYGRFNGKTKGECIRGAIVDWEDFENYKMPEIDYTYREKILAKNFKESEKYVMCRGFCLFSALRDARLMPNALADTLLEPEMVKAFLKRQTDHECEIVETLDNCGVDAMLFGDDWGTQDRTFISPQSFRELFKPYYKQLCDSLHNHGMKAIMHSCGYIYGIIEDLIEAGIDVFQFDQPDIYPSETLAKQFGNRVSFYCPLDIQKVMSTGNLEYIERRAKEMLDTFRKNCGGALIVMDYGSWGDIGVKEEWAKLARDTFINNSKI